MVDAVQKVGDTMHGIGVLTPQRLLHVVGDQQYRAAVPLPQVGHQPLCPAPGEGVQSTRRARRRVARHAAQGNGIGTACARRRGGSSSWRWDEEVPHFLYELLRRAGLGWDDITAAPLEPDKALAALGGGSVDAFAGYGNAIIAARQQGAHTIGSGKDILSGNFLWTASADTLAGAAEREALADLLARLDKAYAYVRDGHEKEYAKVIASATHQPLDQALEEYSEGETQRKTELRLVSAEATASQQGVADAFLELGALKQGLKVSGFWSDRLNTPLRKAPAS
ncbi:hypothetical protein [Streptomyces sp. NPDC088254]|uniref:hypothetical protein n=1 Tax=Streptomyces sp. NPDC088254 TaxID=3365847 RepID=UPI0037F34AA6